MYGLPCDRILRTTLILWWWRRSLHLPADTLLVGGITSVRLTMRLRILTYLDPEPAAGETSWPWPSPGTSERAAHSAERRRHRPGSSDWDTEARPWPEASCCSDLADVISVPASPRRDSSALLNKVFATESCRSLPTVSLRRFEAE